MRVMVSCGWREMEGREGGGKVSVVAVACRRGFVWVVGVGVTPKILNVTGTKFKVLKLRKPISLTNTSKHLSFHTFKYIIFVLMHTKINTQNN